MDIQRDKDSDGRRYYTDGKIKVYSVTTILNELDDDMTGLYYWKKKNDGVGDNAHWKHLFWYKTYRGTLCHYQALVLFKDSFVEEGSMWGGGEQFALERIMYGPTEEEVDDFREVGASTNMNDILYSVLKDHGIVDTRAEYNDMPNSNLLDIATADQKWFVRTFKEIMEHIEIDSSNILSVERFLLNADYGFGGQCDLMYEDKDGNVVVADLKTSSGLRHKHILQSVAYSRAIEQAHDIDVDMVDRVEIIRIHPDTQTWEIHSHDKATQYHTDEGWFTDRWGNYEYGSLEEMWETFVALARSVHER